MGIRRALIDPLRRSPGYVLPVWLSLAAGVAISGTLAALFRFTGWLPPALRSVLRVDAIPATDWPSTWTPALVTPAERQAGGMRALIVVLCVLAGLATAMAVANVLALIAGRAWRRRHEDAVRQALGATRRHRRHERLAAGRPLLIGGAVIGAVLMLLMLPGVRAAWPAGLLPWREGTDPVAALAGIGLPLLFALAAIALPIGVTPERRLQRTLLAAGRSTADRYGRSGGSVLVVAHMALAVSLLTAAGLLLGHARRETLSASGSGLVVDATLAMQLTLPARTTDANARADSWERMLGSLAAMPTVEAESIATPGTWTGLGMRDRVLFECGSCYKGGLYMPIGSDLVYEHAVSDGFFTALGVPVLDGRVFNADDRMDSARVAVVNQSFALQGFEGGKPIGRHIRLGNVTGEWYRIIGVVRDIPPRGVGAPRSASPAVYVSALQVPPRAVGITVRTPGEPDAVAALLEAAIRRIEPAAELGPVSSLRAELDRPVAPLRWLGILFSVLAALALALAAYGMHAAMRNLVEARSREIAIRMAIGAGAARIVGLVLRHAFRLGAAGALAGLFCALVTGRILQLEFTGIPMFDAALTGRVALVLAATLVAGALFPARRATRVQPHAALQEE